MLLEVSAGLRLSAAAGFAADGLAAATVVWLRYGVGRLVSAVGDVEIESLTPYQVRQWHEGLLLSVSAVTANNYLRAVKIVFSRLQRLGVTGNDPAGPVAFAPEPAPRVASVSSSDYEALRAVAAAGSMAARDTAVLDVLWSSGVRLGGLLSMRVDRMERWEDGGRPCFAFYVVEKGGRPRWAYVDEGPALAQWLAVRPSGSPYVWLAGNRPVRRLSASAVQALLRRLRLAAGIPSSRPAHPHAFRHAFAKRRLRGGASLAEVSKWLGHASAEFTADVYLRFSEEELRAAFFGRQAQ